MAKLNIEKFNSRVLRKISKKIDKVTPEIKKLATDMAETMAKERGIGLAAPQVGVLKRLIVVQPDPQVPEIFALINPVISKKSRTKIKKEEGCLSFPNIFLMISRHKKIEIQAIDLNGEEIKIEAEGVAAQVIQHEMDHLDGILFFSRLGVADKIKFKLKYPKIKSWI